MVVLAQGVNAFRTRLPTQLQLLLLGALAGCAAQAPRPAASSYGCMVAERDALPQGMPDDQKHCIASGLIARHCSVTEAHLAGIGKEVQDLFTGGDASWADWQMDRKGMGCAHDAPDDAAVTQCCVALSRSPNATD
jgi:hypothetical protein